MTEFKVQEGFGPVDDNPGDCWDVEVIRCFGTEREAQEFAERWFEVRMPRLMKSQPDWWKSFWVRVIQ